MHICRSLGQSYSRRQHNLRLTTLFFFWWKNGSKYSQNWEVTNSNPITRPLPVFPHRIWIIQLLIQKLITYIIEKFNFLTFKKLIDFSINMNIEVPWGILCHREFLTTSKTWRYISKPKPSYYITNFFESIRWKFIALKIFHVGLDHGCHLSF